MDVDKQTAASVTHNAQAPLTNHKVGHAEAQRWSPPRWTDPALMLIYSEDLKTTAPSNSAFT